MLSLRAAIKSQNTEEKKPQNFSAISGLALNLEKSNPHPNTSLTQKTLQRIAALHGAPETPSPTKLRSNSQSPPLGSSPSDDLPNFKPNLLVKRRDNTPAPALLQKKMSHSEHTFLLSQKLLSKGRPNVGKTPSFGNFLQNKVSGSYKPTVPETPSKAFTEPVVRSSLEELSRAKKNTLSPWSNPNSPDFDDSIPRMFPHDLQRLISEEKDLLLIDLRTNRLELPMIEGAIPLPLPVITDGPQSEILEEIFGMDPDEWEGRYGIPKITPDDKRTIVFYSTSGKRSDMAARACKKLGFSNVKSLVGGSTLYWDTFGATKKYIWTTDNI